MQVRVNGRVVNAARLVNKPPFGKANDGRIHPLAAGERFSTFYAPDFTSADETVEILKGLRDRYEAHHRVTYTDDALKSAVELATRYITGRFLPDKAIDVMDEAGARIRIKSMTAPPDLRDMDVEIARLNKEKEEAVAGQDFEYAFDDIGNRKSTGGRASAQSQYTPNRLNHYSQRTVPGVGLQSWSTPASTAVVPEGFGLLIFE